MPTSSPHRPASPAAWAASAAPPPPEVAVLLTQCGDVGATVRGYRTMLPRAQVYLYGDDLSPDAVACAEVAGAVARQVRAGARAALVRRMFAEVEADIYILAHEADGSDVCVAPLIVAAIDRDGLDLVNVSRFAAGPCPAFGDRLLGRTVDFLFGRGGEAVLSESKACSRRFARSYGGEPDPAASSGLDLALHALRLRMPVGDVAALGRGTVPPPRDLAGWIALLRLLGRLLVEERPRRVLGVLGLAVVAAGIGVALPGVTLHAGRATLGPGAPALLSLAAMMAGGTLMAAGVALDTLAKARQEVKRLGYLAIPRRQTVPGGDAGFRQSSVS